MNLTTIKTLVRDRLDQVEQLLDEQLSSSIPLIKELSGHLIHSGGKRIRPLLVILMSQAYGNTGQEDVLLGTAIELVHAATLLHDDVVDNSSLRRGQKTANAIWDNAASVLVGDFLYSRSFQLMVKANNLEILGMLASATNAISEGEVLQLQNRHNPDIEEENYIKVLRYKTGTLFAASTQIGAILALRPTEEIKVMADFGEYLGVAFQLIDDVLDYAADESTLGKSLGDDLADGKITMPLLYTLSMAKEEEKAFIRQAIMEGQREALPELKKLIDRYQGLQYTQRLAKHYGEEAHRCIEILPDTPYREALFSLINIAVDREF